jgi:5-methylcytosine-specific restriction protein A
MHKGHPDVIRVSNELRELNIHTEIPDQKKFRNPSGISRRLGNFKTMDSGYGGEGLVNSGKLAKEVFKEFNHHRDKLRKEAGVEFGLDFSTDGMDAGLMDAK